MRINLATYNHLMLGAKGPPIDQGSKLYGPRMVDILSIESFKENPNYVWVGCGNKRVLLNSSSLIDAIHGVR